jgi:anthranilate phosphoribosyltransferase
MLNALLKQLISHTDLSKEQIILAVKHLLNPEINTEQKAAFLVLLKSKGENITEIIGFIEVLKQHLQSVEINMPLLDIAGTGGDGLKTINLSTGAALLAASCGAFVAKHGGRAASSHCGTADVLEAINIPIDLPKNSLITSIEKNRFGFLFAPLYHPALKDLKPLRSSLGIPTILNLLCPFLNPANAQHLLIGVSSKSMLSTFAEILLHLNVKKSVVVHSQGMDEISTVGITEVAEVHNNTIRYYAIDPKDFNLDYCDISSLQGHSINENAKILLQAFEGNESPVSDSIALNAGMGLYIYGQCDSLQEGFQLAKENLKNGAVINLIDSLGGIS